MMVLTQSLPVLFSNVCKVEKYILNNISDCIAATMIQEDVPTTQVPQFNDGSNTVSSCVILQKPKDKLCRVPDCIAATLVQEDVPTTLAPTQAPQINAGSDTVHYKFIKYW